MDEMKLKELLAAVAAGTLSPEDAAVKLRIAPVSELGYAKIDNHRGIRQGVSEVIYGESKTAEQIAGIIEAMLAAGQERILITRISAEKVQIVREKMENPELLTYHEQPRVAIVGSLPETNGYGPVVVATGGTSDIPVAEEAALTAEMLGNEVVRLYDCGVAGIHRLLSHVEDLARASVIVSVAGMEGALPSVIGGLTSCPVIAVPTSVGYGASLNGLAALLSMLNSCASGVSVVNIDNGFGAGYQASLINHAPLKHLSTLCPDGVEEQE